MLNLKRASVATAICASIGVMLLPLNSEAGVTSVASQSIVSPSPLVDTVHYRRYYHRHYGYRHYSYRHYGYRHYYGYGYRHHRYYRRYGYYPYYNPVGAFVGGAVGLATAPLWGWGYPYGYGYGYPYAYGW
jgi:hypothetical protein